MKGNELKPRIGLFGRRNVGKSTMVNFLTGQQIAIVSDTAGTTTDPVRKSMEIGGIGPVVLIDTAGIDDEGELGKMRVEKSLAALAEVDLALLLYTEGCYGEPEEMVERWCTEHGTPLLKVLTKKASIDKDALIAQIKEALPESAYRGRSLLGDVVHQGDTVVLVTPIDSSAPEGRMILPQVQVLRDLMDIHGRAAVDALGTQGAAGIGCHRPPGLQAGRRHSARRGAANLVQRSAGTAERAVRRVS